MRIHTIPTHLHVEPKLIPLTAAYGLSKRQAVCLGLGATCGYALWERLAGAPLAPRAGLTLACLALALALALVHKRGRPLEEYCFVWYHYRSLPRTTTWGASSRGRPAGAPDAPRRAYRHELAWGPDAGEGER